MADEDFIPNQVCYFARDIFETTGFDEQFVLDRQNKTENEVQFGKTIFQVLRLNPTDPSSIIRDLLFRLYVGVQNDVPIVVYAAHPSQRALLCIPGPNTHHLSIYGQVFSYS